MKIPGKIKLANLPTKIEFSDKLSTLIGKDIWVKRDDLSGTELTGNKVRKLEFLAADALEKGCDYLITCGGVQSNHARATAIVASKLGMGAFLVLRGEQPEDVQGNLLIDKLLGARIKFISHREYKKRAEIMESVRLLLEKEGKRGYIIPEGGSNSLGSMGYVEAVCEIKSQLEEENIQVDAVVSALGSGGTHTGLLVGAKYFDWHVRVIGVNVCDNASYFHSKIKEISSDMIEQYEINTDIKDEDIHILDGYVGLGYAKSRLEERELLREIAHSTGLIFDPVYTIKALFGLREEIRKGNLDGINKILFMHTGGIFGIFPMYNFFQKDMDNAQKNQESGCCG